MKVLITGISGLLGSNIARKLQERGYEVKGLLRKTSSLRSLEGVDFEKSYGVIQSAADVSRAVEGCDAVIHTAADTHHFTTAYLPAYEINLAGTVNVVEAVKRHQTKRLVYVSTVNVFGNGTLDKPGDETSAFGYQKNNSCYIQSKYQAHNFVTKEARENNLPAVILCPSFMLGPYDAKPSSGKIILLALNKPFNLTPPGGKNFVHVDDVATAAVNALSMGRIGESYIVGNENLSYSEFYRLVEEVSGRKIRNIRIPAGALMGLGKSGEWIQKTFGIHNQLTVSNMSLLCAMHYYSSEKAVRELDFPQTPVKKAIADALEWFSQYDYLRKNKQK